MPKDQRTVTSSRTVWPQVMNPCVRNLAHYGFSLSADESTDNTYFLGRGFQNWNTFDTRRQKRDKLRSPRFPLSSIPPWSASRIASMGKLKIPTKLGRHALELSHPLPTSPTPDLCASNRQPNETEVARILHAISQAESDLAELAQEIKTNPRDAKVRQRYIACSHFLEEHKGPLSPVRRLPYEVLAQIFDFCANDLEPCWTVPSWTLAQVSRRWRAVALTFPEIWGVVPPIRFPMKDNGEKTVPVLKEVLHRSGEHPLSIHISSDENGVVDHAIFQLLIKHCMRWRIVVMDLEVRDFMALTQFIRHRLTSLYSLKITVRMPHDEDYVLEAFSIAPMLREVEIDCPRVQLLIPWEQLTRYTERSTDSIGVIQVLSVSSEISYFSYSTRAIVAIQGHLKPKTLSHMTTLHLNFYNPWVSGTLIISSLTLPALIDLHVRSLDASLVDDLIDLTLRSKCALEKLSIHSLPIKGGVTRILLFTPFLTEFKCNDFTIDDIERLVAIPGIPSVVPCLRKLVIHLDTAMRELNKMILSRHSRRENVALESLTLIFTNAVECFEAQCVLEGWDKVDGKLGGVIGEWRADLEKELINWVTPSREGSWNTAMMNVKVTHQLGIHFRTLESYEFSDAKYIYHSGIHIVMKKVGNMVTSGLPQVEAYNFKERARALVDKWEPLLLLDLPNRHWIRRGVATLEYVPDSSGQ
ncbi:uncharacterized protein LACBIDRAFT_333071 [Laccaria bicolor S238N-H82]|uniref:Predicted protein n=1 Tax=Laccaria bicolor (strain S238N-H82 / ATCC MYA-4686) TaxID=486041 RepID=B0DUS3_LACBS|nr:uncharacterized protein LACBIDRAFT_333071 [Laccaria bicolor S238N-H82]EDR01594.1 predicted protein [Laccaria bicolor S238N-H82]|eukprot:XP_001887670.1 predicted protein [Laccaria bicolor S238N-H82]